jgi:hypothetical protein
MLIPCPECKQKISDQAESCPKCGRPLGADDVQRAAAAARREEKTHQAVALGCLGVFLVLVFAFRGCLEGKPTRIPERPYAAPPVAVPAPPLPEGPQLTMRRADWSWHRTAEMFVEAEGRVTNISSEPLDGVEAVVEFTSADGSFITSASALVDYQPMLPGQSSPWRVMGNWNPAMSKGKAKVSFKHLVGGEIQTKIAD